MLLKLSLFVTMVYSIKPPLCANCSWFSFSCTIACI